MQSQVRFNRVPEKVPEKVWEALVQSQVRVNRVPKVPEKVPGTFDAEPGQVQQGSEEGSGECLGGFGAEPGQVQQGSGEGSGEGSRKPWRKDVQSIKPSQVQRVQEKVPEKGGFVQSQVRFNTVSEKVPGSLGAKMCKAKSGPEKVPENVPEKVEEALVQSQVRFNGVPEKVWEALVQMD